VHVLTKQLVFTKTLRQNHGLVSARALLLLMVVILALCACHRSTPDAVTHVPVARVRVTPARVSLPVGHSLRLNALLGDVAGNRLPARNVASNLLVGGGQQAKPTIGDIVGISGRMVTWRSSDSSRLRVDADGVLTAVAPGPAVITATSEGRIGEVQVIATELSIAPIEVIPSNATLAVGDALQLQAKPGIPQAKSPSGVTWKSDQPELASVDSTGVVTAIAPGAARITASWRGGVATSTLTLTTTGKTIRGLDFPGSAGTFKTVRFEFTSPLAAFPATYIWRAYPRQQNSYYTAFFWGNNGSFYSTNTYYGFHPYPDWSATNIHFWEIAAPPGGDFVSEEHVVYDRWYIQVAICSALGNSTVHEFYWDWPDLRKVVRHVGERQSDPPVPGLIVGDAPWNPGREVWDGVLRGFQFYDAALTPKQIREEIASPGSVRIPWYLNLNPTPYDISDNSGSGHHPTWIGSERASAWLGIEDPTGIVRTQVPPPSD
jgi:hypothetical protein